MQQRHLTKTLGHYQIQSARAVDGDTLEAVILLPFGTLTVKRIRLAGWWAPEVFGPDKAAGEAAQELLQKFVKENVCTIFSRSERTDRYGRIIAALFCNGKAVLPYEVLGIWSLTEEQHKTQHDAAQRWRRAQGGIIFGDDSPPEKPSKDSDWGNIDGAPFPGAN